MDANTFIRTWEKNLLSERSSAQSHFIALCELLDVPPPSPLTHGTFEFEKGADKITGKQGYADVWRDGKFAWEYKRTKANLQEAYKQVLRYSPALSHPPLLIVSDTDRIIIHTAFTGHVVEHHEFTLEDLRDATKRDLLRKAFFDPKAFLPGKTRKGLTEEVAAKFAGLAQALRDRKHDPEKVAHFVNRLVFCMFAEDVGLLPDKIFQQMLTSCTANPAAFPKMSAELFEQMVSGGSWGVHQIPWFNGGLFDDARTFELTSDELRMLHEAATNEWDQIDASIFGTLFERGLDPKRRNDRGEHYTDAPMIQQILEPVMFRPLRAEWQEALAKIRTDVGLDRKLRKLRESTKKPSEAGKLTKQANVAHKRAVERHRAFVERMSNIRVLDPACGSGNFLFVALNGLKDIERESNIDMLDLGVETVAPTVGPQCILGMEISPYAAELARVSVWIGEIQWMRRNGFAEARNPILKPLDTIANCDALLDDSGAVRKWPEVEFIVGNPPFKGAKQMKKSLGIAETEAIRGAFKGRLPGFTDLVCYWFEIARDQIVRGRAKRAGLVATDSLTKNTNLNVMRRIRDDLRIVEAWSSLPWFDRGTAVNVCLTIFDASEGDAAVLDGVPVATINPDLTAGLDLTSAAPLDENKGAAFLGVQKSGPLDVPGDVARSWIATSGNPNGRSNTEILVPYYNGDDITDRPRDRWLIDLPAGLSEAQASEFEKPFEHLLHAIYDPEEDPKETLKEARQRIEGRDEHAKREWWAPYWRRGDMRQGIGELSRYIVTPETAQHRIFTWLRPPILPDKNLIVIPRDDDTTMGILHSRFHRAWALRKGSNLQDRPRYTHTSTFATFPFPEGLTPDVPASSYTGDARAKAIAEPTSKMIAKRDRWLFNDDIYAKQASVLPGGPDVLTPKATASKENVANRTLTRLYNTPPTWLAKAHEEIDAAVAAAYRWETDISDDDALEKLRDMNVARQSAPAGAE